MRSTSAKDDAETDIAAGGLLRQGFLKTAAYEATMTGRKRPRSGPCDELQYSSAVSGAMNGPGTHEDNASSALQDGRAEDAKVSAILALASAVNWLAAAQEASTQDR